MKDQWAIADFKASYIKQERFDILASGIERCLHSLGIEDLQVTCGIVEEDRFEIKISRKENKEDVLKNIYWKHTIKEN
jgi:hypothetical protein